MLIPRRFCHVPAARKRVEHEVSHLRSEHLRIGTACALWSWKVPKRFLFMSTHHGVRTMVNQAVLSENWNDIRATLKSTWRQLTDHDLTGFKGTADQLVNMIQKRTGQARNTIENQLEEMIAQGRSVKNRVGEVFQDAAAQAGDLWHDGYDNASDRLAGGYRDATAFAKENPGAAVAILFGSGLLAGLGIAMLMRRQ